MMDALEKELKERIVASYRARYGRDLDSSAYWLRLFAHPRYIAARAHAQAGLANMKAEWNAMQAAAEKKK